MIIEPTEERKVIFENLKEVEAAWPLIAGSSQVTEMRDSNVKQTIQDTAYDIETLLEKLGFKNPEVHQDIGYYQGSGASFTADCFCIEPDKKIDLDDLREKSGFEGLINIFEGLYEKIKGHKVMAEYYPNSLRTYLVHCKTLGWEITISDTEIASDNNSIELGLESLECEVERILEKVYDEIVLDYEWIKEAVIGETSFVLSIEEIEAIEKRLLKKDEE